MLSKDRYTCEGGDGRRSQPWKGERKAQGGGGEHWKMVAGGRSQKRVKDLGGHLLNWASPGSPQ